MRFTTEQNALLSALRLALSVISPRPSRAHGMLRDKGVTLEATLNGVRLEAVSDSGGVQIEVPAITFEKGETVVGGRFLERMLRGFGKGALSIEFDEAHSVASISRGGCRADMGKSSDAFWKDQIPPLKPVEGQKVEIEWRALNAALRAVIFAVSESDSRPVLQGVCFTADGSGTDLVAVDGIRMAVYRLPLTNVTGQWLIPAASFRLANRLFKHEKTVTVTFGEGAVQFAASNATLAAKTIGGTFPPYKAILEATSERTTVRVDRLSLLAVVERMAAFSLAEEPELRICTSEKRLHLSMEDTVAGTAFRDELEAEIQGQPLSVAFNPRLLRDVLSQAGGDRVTIGLESSFKPAVFRGGLEGWTAVVMPMRMCDDRANAA